MTFRSNQMPLTHAMMQTETREEMIARWEKEGLLDPDCKECHWVYDSPALPSHVFAPSHKASSYCQSGKKPHCTCDTCF